MGQEDAFQRNVFPFLDQYCIACHASDDAEGGITLDGFLDHTSSIQGGRTWLQVLDVVETGVMPPQGEPQPSIDDRRRVVDWIENDFISAQCGNSAGSA
ncbi:MAG: c-type cytochrome domain-containing protein, partial [Aureliella sp.]